MEESAYWHRSIRDDDECVGNQTFTILSDYFRKTQSKHDSNSSNSIALTEEEGKNGQNMKDLGKSGVMRSKRFGERWEFQLILRNLEKRGLRCRIMGFEQKLVFIKNQMDWKWWSTSFFFFSLWPLDLCGLNQRCRVLRGYVSFG